MKSNKKIVDDSIEEKKEKMLNTQSKTSINLNSTKKIFPSTEKNFKSKNEKDKDSISNVEKNQNNNINVG